MTHCQRELLHAQWDILLDDEFIRAYKHGIVVGCCNDIMWRFYPRIITYSGDYKEKYVTSLLLMMFILIEDRVIVATIHDLGCCPCPRCLVQLVNVHNMGKIQDMKQRETNFRIDDDDRRRKVDIARNIIYKKNYAVDHNAVETLLQEQSLVLTTVSARKFFATAGANNNCCWQRMHSLASFPSWALVCSLCLLLILCMTSSWEFGETYSFTSSGYWRLLIKLSLASWTIGMSCILLIINTRFTRWYLKIPAGPNFW